MNEDPTDELDLEIAEAFSALDSYQPIDTHPTAAMAPVTAVSASNKTLYRVLALAAVFALIAVVSIITFAGGDPAEVASGPTDEVEDSTGDPDPEVPADEADGAVIEPPTTTTSAAPETTTAAPTTTTTTQLENASEPDPAGSTMPPPEPPPTTEAPDTTATDPPDGSVQTTVPSGTTPAPPVNVEFIEGVVTEILMDCNSHVMLDENGDVVELPVLCDGGSYVVVDGSQIRTSSGFGPAGSPTFNSPVDVELGQVAAFAALRDPDTGSLSLDCDACGQAFVN